MRNGLLKFNNIKNNDYEAVRIPTDKSVTDRKGEVPNNMVKMDITTVKAPN